MNILAILLLISLVFLTTSFRSKVKPDELESKMNIKAPRLLQIRTFSQRVNNTINENKTTTTTTNGNVTTTQTNLTITKSNVTTSKRPNGTKKNGTKKQSAGYFAKISYSAFVLTIFTLFI